MPDEPLWVLIHARYSKALKLAALARELGCAVGSRETVVGTHEGMKARMDVVAAMDDPAKRAAIMKAAGL